MGDVKEALDALQGERNRLGVAPTVVPPGVPPAIEGGQPLVVFMTPSIDHCVTIGFLKSYVETMALLGQHGWSTAFQSFGGDPYLSKVRNLCVSTTLRNFPHATHMFFLDADLEWDAESALRAVQHPGDIVAGIYCKKNDTPDFPASLIADKDTGKFLEQDGLIRAQMVPTGFLRVKRAVYAAMAERSLRYRDSMGEGVECWNIFEMGFAAEPTQDGMDGQWWGEDCAWSRKAIEMGYEILVDPAVKFGHRGGKTWRFHFGDYVQGYREGRAKIIDKSDGSGEKVVGVEGLLAAE